jgi:hypothetical protein
LRKIDAVITWVDGGDPNHRAKRLRALEQCTSSLAWNSNATTRFKDTGEIYFCLASILKYAPFIRNIFVVTDAQVPAGIDSFFESGICDPTKIKVVDHSEIFRGLEQALPTFNSLSIETMLWRIPDLSEEFIYFNDDMFLASESTLQDFVLPDGRLVLYGIFMRVWPRVFKARLKQWRTNIKPKKTPKFSHKLGQAMAAHRLGHTRYLAAGHTPKVLRKSTLAAYFNANRDILERQIGYMFRSRNQFNPIALANSIEIDQHAAVVRGIEELFYLEPRDLSSCDFNSFQSSSYKFGCIQSADEFDPIKRSKIYAILIDKFRDALSPEITEELRISYVDYGDLVNPNLSQPNTGL